MNLAAHAHGKFIKCDTGPRCAPVQMETLSPDDVPGGAVRQRGGGSEQTALTVTVSRNPDEDTPYPGLVSWEVCPSHVQRAGHETSILAQIWPWSILTGTARSQGSVTGEWTPRAERHKSCWVLCTGPMQRRQYWRAPTRDCCELDRSVPSNCSTLPGGRCSSDRRQGVGDIFPGKSSRVPGGLRQGRM